MHHSSRVSFTSLIDDRVDEYVLSFRSRFSAFAKAHKKLFTFTTHGCSQRIETADVEMSHDHAAYHTLKKNRKLP